MDIGEAVKALREGKRVAREGWNGRGMWLVLVPETEWGASGVAPREPYVKLRVLPFVGMRTADEKFVPWLCSQTDLLATDWQVVE